MMGRSCLLGMDQDTRDRKNANQRAYYARNREARRAWAHENYAKHRADPDRVDAANAYQREYRRKNRERITHNAYRRRVLREYGLEWNEYLALAANGCAICGSDDRLVVDHCHRSGKTRSVLCHACNTGLGMFGDDAARLTAAATYLGEFGA